MATFCCEPNEASEHPSFRTFATTTRNRHLVNTPALRKAMVAVQAPSDHFERLGLT